MKTSIYFVRHGKVKNPKNILYGRLPGFPLDPVGKLQIEKTAKFLSDKNIDILYSSPLLRARQSAEIMKNKLNLPLRFSKSLLEVRSSLEGKSFSDIQSINYNIFAFSGNKITGETIERVLKRMQKFISRITSLHKGRRIAIVSHGDPIMIVKAKVEGLPVKNASIRPGEKKYIQHGQVYLLEFEEGEADKMISVFSPTY